MKKPNLENVKNKKFKCFGIISSLIFTYSCEEGITHPLYVEGGGVYDMEGNYYETVVIGDQEWMAENLKSNLYCNGDSIPYSGTDIRVKTYDNDQATGEVFGMLYNYQAVVDTSGLCPCGWHIPNELEYAVLINYLGGYEDAMKKMKSIGSIEDDGRGLWSNPNHDLSLEGNNESGFNALPGGYGFYANFYSKDSIASFWALPTDGNDAIEYTISIGLPYVEKQRNTLSQAKIVLYYSVRCIKSL